MSWSERMRARYESDRMTGQPVDILAIETSCDETAAAVVRDGRVILSSVVASQVGLHDRFGGVVPEVASRAHVEHVSEVVDAALRKAGRAPHSLQAVAVTFAPGLIGALFVGVTSAKTMAQFGNLPLIGVHHLAGHMFAAMIGTDMQPPFLALVVSGGHTELLGVHSGFAMERLGSTRDDAAGEAFDKIARALELGYPGGPAIERIARDGDPFALPFPRAKLEEGALDFSFSGLKSAVLLHLDRQRRTGGTWNAADVAASFQRAVIDALVEKVEMALERTRMRTLVLAGGVAANRSLRARLESVCAADGARFVAPPAWLCTDNAAMIGAAAHWRYVQGRLDDLSLTAQAVMPLQAWR